MSKKDREQQPADQDIAKGESLEKMDRIRELVFGSQMRDYNQRFEVVNRDLGRLQQEINRLNEQLSVQAHAASQRLNEVDARLSAELQNQARLQTEATQAVDHKLTDQVQALDRRTTEQFREADKKNNTRFQEIAEQLAQVNQELQRALRQIEGELRGEVRDWSERLTHDKTDRFSLGDLLIELGSNLKEGDSSRLAGSLLDELSRELE